MTLHDTTPMIEGLVWVDSDSSLASNAAVGRSTLRAGGCHLLDDWRASSFRVNRLWVANSQSSSNRGLKQTAAMLLPSVTIKRSKSG